MTEIITLTGTGLQRPQCAKMYPLSKYTVEQCVEHFQTKWGREVEKVFVWQGYLYIEFDPSWEEVKK